MKTPTLLEETIIRKIDRRSFLKATGLTATGVVLGLQMQSCAPKKVGAPFSPNVYLTINGDGTIVIVAHRQEMGTGIRTNLPLVLADELGADWSKVSLVQAVGDEPKYGDQNTDGSYSVRMFFEPMRKAGASARLMLEKAAASQWGVSVSECKAEDNAIVNKQNGKKIPFGDLTEIASKLEVPKAEEIKLKDKSEWKYIGKSTGTYDAPYIANGTAVFGLDKKVEGMKYAVVARCPVWGGKVKTYNADKAKVVPGVIAVKEIPASNIPADFHVPMGGIAIVADNTWSAIQGRNALEIEWDFGPNADYDTEAYINEMKAKVKKKGTVRRANGNIDSAIAGAANVLESTYVIPHLSHAPMEPPNAVASYKDGKCEVWAPVQSPMWVRNSVTGFMNLKLEDVTVNVTLLGGAFGRKSKPDFVCEAAWLSKEMAAPIKVVWTRECDLTNDFFHAVSVQNVRVAFDKNKKVTGWYHRSAFPPIGGTTNAKEIEPSAGETQLGLVDFPYNIPNIQCESIEAKAKTRIGWLRSVSNIQQAFAVGSMLDEIAAYRGVDPVANLLELLGPDRKIAFNELVKDKYENYGESLEKFPWDTARLRNVIELVRDKSGWGKELPKGHGLGICAHKSFLTYVACVIHVAVDDAGKISIPELHYAVDCGIPVNRNSVINQFEGGAVFALNTALKSGITFKNGRSQETNFHQYQVMRMTDAPAEIFVHLVENDEKPTGVGEPPVPPVAPALANAIFAATGKRVRELPMILK
jgi:isoquinoline 1-oxidoreductase beta subunit